MESDINPGVDCCRDANRPSRLLHVTPSIVWAKPGDQVVLHAKTVYYDCDSSCIYWRILTGSGHLRHEFGRGTVFYVARDKQGCEANATVGMYCGGILLDVARIGVNTYKGNETAYFRTSLWRDGRYMDPDWHEEIDVPRAGWPKEWIVKGSYIKITRHNCAGHVIGTMYPQLRQVCLKDRQGVVRYHQTFLTYGEADERKLRGKIPPLAFKIAKQMELDELSRDTYRPPYEKFVRWPFPHMVTTRYGVDPPFMPGGTADVRTDKMIEKGCCSPYVS